MKQFLPLAVGLVATAGLSDLVWVAPIYAADDTSSNTDQTAMPVENSADSSTSQSSSGKPHSSSVALSFDPPNATSVPIASEQPTTAARSESTPIPQSAPDASSSSREDLFAGGSKSIVARTVGAAEGTRNADGSTTEIYEGHVDPGNGVWNRGTFSYQFGNEENLSADEADRRQMAKIKRIYESIMLAKAQKHGVTPLSVAEEINGIDMINQAPLAVTEDGGYIERLAEAKKKGLTGQAAILDARVWAFWDSTKGGWDAPGLRAYDDMGKEASIRHDQKRRMGMIEDALASYQQQHGAIAERSQAEQKTAVAQPKDEVASRPTQSKQEGEKRADLIIFGGSSVQDMPVAMAQR